MLIWEAGQEVLQQAPWREWPQHITFLWPLSEVINTLILVLVLMYVVHTYIAYLIIFTVI